MSKERFLVIDENNEIEEFESEADALEYIEELLDEGYFSEDILVYRIAEEYEVQSKTKVKLIPVEE